MAYIKTKDATELKNKFDINDKDIYDINYFEFKWYNKNTITKTLPYTKKHMTIDSGSLQKEVHERLGVLYNNHHQWLTAVAYNKSKDKQLSQDLVQDLYVYLAEKQNPKVFFNDSFNLLYCYNFLSSRFINYIKRKNKTTNIVNTEQLDKPIDTYNVQEDKRLEHAYDCIKKELDTLKSSRMWSSAKLYELYAFSDLTMEELSSEVGISKSTTFLNIKKIKLYLKDKIDNPFKDNTDE